MKTTDKAPLSFPNIYFPALMLFVLIAFGVIKDNFNNPHKIVLIIIFSVWLGFGLKQWSNDEN